MAEAEKLRMRRMVLTALLDSEEEYLNYLSVMRKVSGGGVCWFQACNLKCESLVSGEWFVCWHLVAINLLTCDVAT